MLFYTNHFNWMERNLVLMKMVDQERPVVLECTGRNLIHRRAGIADCSYQTEYCWPTLEIQVHLQLEKVLAASSKKKKIRVRHCCREHQLQGQRLFGRLQKWIESHRLPSKGCSPQPTTISQLQKLNLALFGQNIFQFLGHCFGAIA